MSIIMTAVTRGRDAGFTMHCRIHGVLVPMSENRSRVCVNTMQLINNSITIFNLTGAC